MQLDDPGFVTRSRRTIVSPQLVKDESARQLGLAAIDAFAHVVSGAALNAECLEKIAAAASSSEALVPIKAAGLLNLLASDHEMALGVIWRLLREGNDHARFAAVCAATGRNKLPRAFVIDTLRVGLRDVEPRLQIHAAAEAGRLGIGELVPAMLDLRRRLEAQGTADIDNQAAWLDLYIGFARDGYWVRLLSDSETDFLRGGSASGRARYPGKIFNVSVRLDGSDSMTGGYASESELQERGAAAIAEDIRRRFFEGERRRSAERGKVT